MTTSGTMVQEITLLEVIRRITAKGYTVEFSAPVGELGVTIRDPHEPARYNVVSSWAMGDMFSLEAFAEHVESLPDSDKR